MGTNTYAILPDKEDIKKKPKLKLSQIFEGLKRQIKGIKKVIKKNKKNK